MKILAIETSCDETAAAVLNDQATPWVLSSVVASQDDLHKRYGGVVPELASRRHIDVLPAAVEEALERAKLSLNDLDGVAVTHSPGLMGALLVGLSYAKGLSVATGLPLIGVNHLSGHLAAVLLDGSPLPWPHVGLIVSGGHTGLYLGERTGYQLLGSTRDDAAGEAFDKVAKLLGLGYPGGREIERLAGQFAGRNAASPLLKILPQMRLKSGETGFSFSGLKTAVAQLLRDQPGIDRAELAWAFQERVFEFLRDPVARVIAQVRPKGFILCGGVAANQRLRRGFAELCQQQGISLKVPEMKWCTDNAAMIGAAGILKLRAGHRDSLSLRANPQASHDLETLLRDFFPQPVAS